MRVGLVSSFVLLSGCVLAEGRWAGPDDPTARWMIEQERLWADEACDRNGVTRTLVADDYVGTSPRGTVYTKADLVGVPLSAPRSHDCRLLEARVRFFGAETAIVYGYEFSVPASPEGAEVPQCLRWTDTWLKRAGRWQIVAAQDMRQPCP
jgi:hypothetical protein